jgi:hypothetical protein
MKKTFFILALGLAALASMVQKYLSDLDKDVSGPKSPHNFVCMDISVFGQIPLNYNIGIYAEVGYEFSKVADDYAASGPISSMRFWGVYDIKPYETFLIEFYNGQPGQPGTSVVHTFNVTTSPIPTPYLRNGSVIYEFNVDFGKVIIQQNGWVSISRTTPSSDIFAWIGDTSTGNCLSYNTSNFWMEDYWQVFFCLGNKAVIPVSGWALFMGLGLILALTVIRFRKAS